MQGFCFYPFSLSGQFSGNAGLLLLPFFPFRTIFGQCRASAFTLFPFPDNFRAMQSFCFYPFSLSGRFSGNAELASLLTST
jgi:hypothetical protein